MNDDLIKGIETVSMFCRLNINIKKDLPIRSSEMGLLILVSKSNDNITPGMAADFFKVKKPMITAMISNLIKQGFIDKVLSNDDKRSFTLKATDKAKLLVNETYSEYMKTIELLRQKLGVHDFWLLITLLEKSNTILLEGKNNG